MENIETFWTLSPSDVLKKLSSRPEGLSDEEARERKNLRKEKKELSPLANDVLLLLSQFKNPLTLILIFAVILSSALGEYTNTIIISGIILLTGLLGFWQERNANRAVEKLRALVRVKVNVKRNGKEKEIISDEIVPGDIILLNAGDIIPADCFILESKDLHVNESALTGESFPSEKEVCKLKKETSLSKRKNSVFNGTNVVSGTATVLVVLTGEDTELGKISSQIEKEIPETAFETGIKKFGYMLMKVTIVLSLIIMLLNIYYGKAATDSFLFALALAVGMTPELLPAIVTITHSAGAERMAKQKVIVKKLSAIQNLGAVDVFCSDKTGTLTEGTIKVHSAVDVEGKASEKILRYAFLNASFETGFSNPVDNAIRDLKNVKTEGYSKFDEVPYDFIRRRLSIVVEKGGRHLMITKGALKNILEVCTKIEVADENTESLDRWKEKIQAEFEKFSSDGFRTIGICCKDVTGNPVINHEDESEMIFLGFILLSDPPKEGIAKVINELHEAGIKIKLITGDNRFIASHVGKQIGFDAEQIVTGIELQKISGHALTAKVRHAQIFAEVEPGQKERIVQALKKSGSVVGFIGDGINDVSALKASDVSISVDTAVDIAKETADIVFLKKDLKVLHAGIIEGRKTFINTLKYIFIASSSNFGNMFSVAGASLFLSFLPLLPKQILLTNFLTDIPAMAISSDSVDEELLKGPRKWNTKLIRNFMMVFGIQSSLFDFLTFFVLLYIFHANTEQFRTGWFIESVVTGILILMIIRTQRSIFDSMPGKLLAWISLAITIAAILIPYLPFAFQLEFSPLPLRILAGMGMIALFYACSTELTKRIFFKRLKYYR